MTRPSSRTPAWPTAAWRRPTATCNNLVLALILHRRQWDTATAALRYFTLRRKAAFEALLAPG